VCFVVGGDWLFKDYYYYWHYCYSVVLSSDGTSDQDIQRRIGLACDAMNRLATIC